jgi:lipoprotein signal peptidase
VIQRSPLPTLPAAIAIAVFAAGDLVIDRMLSSEPSTFHHARPAVLVIPALALGVLAWLTRAKLPAVGQVGIVLCIAGAAGNAASLLFDPAGVSDYLRMQIGNYLVVLNVADVIMLSGLILVVVAAASMGIARLTGQASAN